MPKLSPIESEFETAEQAEAYDRWFRAKVQASLDDPRPSLPHDAVMAELDRIIAEAEQEQSRYHRRSRPLSGGHRPARISLP